MRRWSSRLLFAVCLLGMCLAHAGLPDPVRFSVVLETGDIAQARRWLDAGLDPDFEGALIGTGLMIGAWEGNIPLMELFLSRGADIQHTNRFGETALMLATWKNQEAAVRWLLEHGAQPGSGKERAWSALHYAAFAGHAALIDVLLTAGADVNARSTNGSTVIMMAAREGHAGIVRRLLSAGADPRLKNDYGDDAIAWAMRQRHYDIARSLTSAENFAALAREAAHAPPPPPQRSEPAPDIVEEHLRMARLAEAKGKRSEALAAYRKALAALKAQQSPRKVPAQPDSASPAALVIKAKRSQPEKQVMAFIYGGSDEAGLERLLTQARAAAAAGKRQEALRLYREASARIKAGR